MPDEPTPPSREVRDEQFWRDGGGFHWMLPFFHRFNPADRRSRFLLNRYPHNVIGAGAVVFGHGWGVLWKGSHSRKDYRRVLRGGHS